MLVIDEAGMIGSRQMERVLSAARDAAAKVVLVGDPEQLQAIKAGAAFRSIAERHGAVEITQIRRQREDWQRDATRALATGRTGEAIAAYDQRGMVHETGTREVARTALVDGWDRERQAAPDQSRIILTHTNVEVAELNRAARKRLRMAGELGADVSVAAERGAREFAQGDRIMFLKNERSVGVKNGTLGTVEQVSPERMTVRLDDGRNVAFDVKDYAHIDHGYDANFHKSQGVTVDRTHVLATPGMDRHAAYVGLSRHRDAVQLHYGQDDFADRDSLVRALSRERGKDMASDYAPEQIQAFAERRGIARDPATERQIAARAAFERHAQAVSAVFQSREGAPELPTLRQELTKARRALDAFGPDYSRDVERAYKADHSLAHEAGGGRVQRAIQAMRLEAELRIDAPARAERFAERWKDLDAQRGDAYQRGDMHGMRRIRDSMGAMAKGLERDPQLESILAARKQQLGIGMDISGDIKRDLAMSIGFDMGRARGIGI